MKEEADVNADVNGMVRKLLADMEQLDEKYISIFPPPLPSYETNLNAYHKELIRSGQLLIDFYYRDFLSKYKKMKEKNLKPFVEVSAALDWIAATAREAINIEDYDTLRNLLASEHGEEGASNTIELMIDELKKELQIGLPPSVPVPNKFARIKELFLGKLGKR